MNTATTPKAMRPTLRPGRVNAYSRRLFSLIGCEGFSKLRSVYCAEARN